MRNVMLKIRVFLEGFFLGFGAVGVWFCLYSIAFNPLDRLLGRGAGDLINVIDTVLVAVLLVLIMVGRRKDLGERISTWLYVVLSIIPFSFVAWFYWIIVNSFD